MLGKGPAASRPGEPMAPRGWQDLLSSGAMRSRGRRREGLSWTQGHCFPEGRVEATSALDVHLSCCLGDVGARGHGCPCLHGHSETRSRPKDLREWKQQPGWKDSLGAATVLISLRLPLPALGLGLGEQPGNTKASLGYLVLAIFSEQLCSCPAVSWGGEGGH